MEGWAQALGVSVEILPDTRFVTPPGFFNRWAEGRRQFRMEYF